MVYFGLKCLRVRPRFAGRQHQTKNTKIVRIFKILSQNYTQNPCRPEFAVTKMNNCITFETVLVSKMITCPSKALANTCKFRTHSVSKLHYAILSLPSSPYSLSLASKIMLGSNTSTVCHAPAGTWQPYCPSAGERWMRSVSLPLSS